MIQIVSFWIQLYKIQRHIKISMTRELNQLTPTHQLNIATFLNVTKWCFILLCYLGLYA